jgi:hypothetical protein
MIRVTMKNYPRLLCLHVYSDLKRKEFICLLHSNSACTMRLENSETPSRNREYSCHIVVITNEDGSLPGIVPVSSVQCYGSVQGVEGSVHQPREAPKSNVFSG